MHWDSQQLALARGEVNYADGRRKETRPSRRQSPGEIAAAATSHNLPSRGSVHASAATVRSIPIQVRVLHRPGSNYRS